MADKVNEVSFHLDLTVDEVHRRAAVFEALGDTWDPLAAILEEEQAYAMLYSGLDAERWYASFPAVPGMYVSLGD